MKRFVISTDPMTADQEKAFKAIFPAEAGWWHWLPNFWLVKDPSGTLTPSILTSAIQGIDKTKRALVLQISQETWSALTAKDEKGNEMAAWIRSDWVKKD